MVTCHTLLCVCVQYVGSIVIRFNILFHESRHFYHITIEWGRLYCIDTSLSQHLINDIKHNKYVVGQRLKPSR